MNNPPAFQFYPKDFISDLNVQAMTLQETGAYIRLLCLCWIEDGIPKERISKLVDLWLANGSTNAQAGTELWLKIEHCFYEKDSKYRNKRLDEERNKQLLWHEKSSKGGKKSAENRRFSKGGSTKGQPKGNQGSTKHQHSPLPSSSSNEDSRESSIKAENTGQLFEEFWTSYPREGRFHKKACLQKFETICRNGGLDALKAGFAGYLGYLKHQELNENFKQKPMHVSTFLNKERFKTYVGFRYEARL